MPNPIESSIVRILDANDDVVGAGFLVAGKPENLVLTCAHVVDAALDRTGDTSSQPSEEVRLNFSHIAPHEILTAQVACWHPQRTEEKPHDLDVALLRLSGGLPSDARPASLVEGTDLWEHSFRAFGFPKNYPDGVWARGVVLGGKADGRVEIVADKEGHVAVSGFSGAPVWDNLASGVVGMIVESDSDPAARSAGMIPNSTLQEACPVLRPLVVPPREAQPAGGPYDPVWYIARSEENLALRLLRDPGFPAVLWGPRSAGKSWTFQHLIERLKKQPGGPRHIVEIDLADYDRNIRNSIDDLLRELASRIVDELGLSYELVEESWNSETGKAPKDRLHRLLKDRIFPQIDGQLVLAIERADAIWGFQTQDELFSLLRRWAGMSRREPWSRLRLLLAVSTTPVHLSQKDYSPFNLAQPVDLRDLSSDQVQQAVQMYGLAPSADEFDRLMDLTKGHPYLVRLALFEAAFSGHDLSHVLDERNLDRAYGWHLQGYWDWLEDRGDLLNAMKSSLHNPQQRLAQRDEVMLQRAGLIEWRDDEKRYCVRYPLYEKYLRSRL